jgi:hypothetical protein
MGPLGGNQGLWPYPSGPSQPSIPFSLGHFYKICILWLSSLATITMFECLRIYQYLVICAVFGKRNDLSLQYTALYVMVLMRADSLRGHVGGGGALETETFLGPVTWYLAVRRVPFGAKKWSSGRTCEIFNAYVFDTEGA